MSSAFPAGQGIRFTDPMSGSPRTAICADTSGTVNITNVESNLAGSSDDLLVLRDTASEFSTTTTTYMTITKNGITKKDGTAKQLYTEAGGTATIGTTSDTASYTAVAPLNGEGRVPASYAPHLYEYVVCNRNTSPVNPQTDWSFSVITSENSLALNTYSGIASWLYANNYKLAYNTYPVTGVYSSNASNAVKGIYSTNGTSFVLLYGASGSTGYTADSTNALHVIKRTIF